METFKLSVYAPIILPLMAVYIVLAMEAIGDISATCEVSRLQVDGEVFDSRIQVSKEFLWELKWLLTKRREAYWQMV